MELIKHLNSIIIQDLFVLFIFVTKIMLTNDVISVFYIDLLYLVCFFCHLNVGCSVLRMQLNISAGLRA